MFVHSPIKNFATANDCVPCFFHKGLTTWVLFTRKFTKIYIYILTLLL